MPTSFPAVAHMIPEKIFFLLLLTCANVRCGNINREEFTHTLGATVIKMERIRYEGPSSLSIVHVHDNEATALRAAEKVLAEAGGSLVTIRNRSNRLLKFLLEGKHYMADPNRVYTAQGRKNTLEKLSRFDPSAAEQLEQFATYFIGIIPDADVVVSMHNNTDKAYSVLSYNKGGDLFNDAAAVHINSAYDADDFFITTSADLYEQLKTENYNVVLQNNDDATDDGSLSIYYGRKEKGYINIEAEHGHLKQQIQMLQVLNEVMHQLPVLKQPIK
jgi:hypothetical protein